jgi:hypothetical protein
VENSHKNKKNYDKRGKVSVTGKGPSGELGMVVHIFNLSLLRGSRGSIMSSRLTWGKLVILSKKKNANKRAQVVQSPVLQKGMEGLGNRVGKEDITDH